MDRKPSTAVVRHVTTAFEELRHSTVAQYSRTVQSQSTALYPIAELGVYRGTYFAPPSIASALVQSPHQNFNLSHGIPGIYLE